MNLAEAWVKDRVELYEEFYRALPEADRKRMAIDHTVKDADKTEKAELMIQARLLPRLPAPPQKR